MTELVVPEALKLRTPPPHTHIPPHQYSPLMAVTESQPGTGTLWTLVTGAQLGSEEGEAGLVLLPSTGVGVGVGWL